MTKWVLDVLNCVVFFLIAFFIAVFVKIHGELPINLVVDFGFSGILVFKDFLILIF